MAGETTTTASLKKNQLLHAGTGKRRNSFASFLLAISLVVVALILYDTIRLHDSVLEATAPLHNGDQPFLPKTNTESNLPPKKLSKPASNGASDSAIRATTATTRIRFDKNQNVQPKGTSSTQPPKTETKSTSDSNPTAETKTRIRFDKKKDGPPEAASNVPPIAETKTGSNPAAAVTKTALRFDENETESDLEDGIERALFLICMGEYAAKSKVVERFVYSARNAGRFSGWIVLLTDAPSSRYEQPMANVNNGTETNNLIVIKPRKEDIKTHYKYASMTYKRFKTMILDYVDRESKLKNVELVYYLDADIVFGNDLRKAFRGLETTYGIGRLGANKANNNTASTSTINDSSFPTKNKTPIARGKMWMFRGNHERRWPFQGGQIIIDRAISRPCLERWRKGFDKASSSEKKDQNLLRVMKEEIKDANRSFVDCEIVGMKHAPYIEFPERRQIKNLNKQLLEKESVLSSTSTANTTTNTNANTTTNYEYSPMVHLRNDGIFDRLNSRDSKLYMKNLLRFEEGQIDHLGILNRVSMENTKKATKKEK